MEKLILWKEKADKQPILITGPKAVGKTTIIKEFAGKYYKKFIHVDLKKDKDNFLYMGKLLRKGFDEEMSRYISPDENKEDILIVFDHFDMEQAGINTFDDIIRFIVYNLMDYNICLVTLFDVKRFLSPDLLNKLDIFSMQPISIKEFFIINNDRELLKAVENNPEKSLSPQMLEKIKLYIKVYFITGGMPKVIQTYMNTRDLNQVNEARKEVFQDYLSEINDISDEKLKTKVRRLYFGITAWMDSQDKSCQYGISSYFTGIKEWEKAVEWLINRQMVIKLEALKEVKVPLENNKKKKVFKLYYHDIGILTYAYGIQFADIIQMDYPYALKNYALIEQFVLQQLLVSELKGASYYWMGSEKEYIEFICENRDELIPVKIECKNGNNKIVDEYQAKYHPDLFVLITNEAFKASEPVIKIPSFFVWNL